MRFLSTQWFDALDAALARACPPGTAGERVAIGQVVTGTPDGEVAYTVVLGGDAAPALVRGSTAPAEVVLVEDYATARAIASGAAGTDVLASGALKVRGDANALVRAQECLVALTGTLGTLAGSTEY